VGVNQGTLLELAETLYPPFSDLLYGMERAGVFVSIPELERIASEAERDIHDSAAKLNGFSGQERNWNAGAEVAEFLYDQLGLPELPDEARSPKFWGKERITAHEALEYFHRHYPERRPEIETLRAYRRACKSRNFVVDLMERARPTEWPGIGVVHPTYGSYSDSSAGRDKTGTSTGRVSISNPALQQTSRDKTKDPYRIRLAFVAPPGKRLCVVDMEQLEVRIQGHVHIALFDDPTLRNFCVSGDFHGLVAYDTFSSVWPNYCDWSAFGPNDIKEHSDAKIKWVREPAKVAFYGQSYGRNEKTFAKVIWDLAGNPIGLDAATALVKSLHTKIPAIPKYQQWVRETVAEKGGMWDVFGVWRPLERDNRGWRQGLNQPFQGSGARLVAYWMLLMRGLDQRLQVHDEVIVVADEDKADRTVKIMEMAAFQTGELVGLKCPLKGKGSHAMSWEEAK
jgi:DNA polymerase-1